MTLRQPPIILVTTILLLVSAASADNTVHILLENLDQTVTSNTLQWIQTDGSDYHLLKNAVVAAYQTVDEPHSTEIPENVENEILSKQAPIFICRARVTGMWVTGQLRPKSNVCVVSFFKTQEAKQFEVLINIENSGRLSWVTKTQFSNLPAGAVTSSDSNIINLQQQRPLFVARKPVKSDNKTGAVTHYVGAFNPTENLGVFRMVDQDNMERVFEDGELLIETQPIAYKIRNIKFLKLGRRIPKKKVILAHTILKNEIEGLQKVESVMSYTYNYSLSWRGQQGLHRHGLQKGLPYTLTLPNGSQNNGLWEIRDEGERVDTVPVSMELDENTGVNITLIGYASDTEEPYTATVASIYKDKEEREIIIKDIKREKKILDVEIEKSPIYFLNNNTFVPTTPPPTTTSTTTMSTTKTTTTRITSTTQDVTPILEPEVVMNRNQGLQAADKKDDSVGMMSDEHSIRSAPQEVKSHSSIATLSAFLSFAAMLLAVFRVT